MNYQRLNIQIFKFLIYFILFPASAVYANPPGMMHDMDNRDMDQMMNQRGYGHGSGFGYPGMDMSNMGNMMGPMMGILYSLELDDKQKDKIRGIQKNMRKQHWGLMEKMADTTDKLYDLYNVDKPDPEKIGKVYDEIYKIKRQMIQEHIDIRNKIYDILSSEQREKFKANDPFKQRFGMMF